MSGVWRLGEDAECGWPEATVRANWSKQNCSNKSKWIQLKAFKRVRHQATRKLKLLNAQISEPPQNLKQMLANDRSRPGQDQPSLLSDSNWPSEKQPNSFLTPKLKMDNLVAF